MVLILMWDDRVHSSIGRPLTIKHGPSAITSQSTGGAWRRAPPGLLRDIASRLQGWNLRLTCPHDTPTDPGMTRTRAPHDFGLLQGTVPSTGNPRKCGFGGWLGGTGLCPGIEMPPCPPHRTPDRAPERRPFRCVSVCAAILNVTALSWLPLLASSLCLDYRVP